MEAAVEFERLVRLIRSESKESVPHSVQQRYERRLAALREQIRQAPHAHRLGAILVSEGALTDRQLQEALEAQRVGHSSRLLGEHLLELHYVDARTLSNALAIQNSVRGTPQAIPIGQHPE